MAYFQHARRPQSEDTALYDLLSVNKNATDHEIKRSYKKLAKQFHPDKNPQNGEKFKEIAYAYEILSNPEKRETYDNYGMDGIKEGVNDGGGMDDIFSHFFGGGMFGGGMFGGGHPGMRRRKRKGQDMVHRLKVTLEDLYNGKTSKLQLSKNVICNNCNGRGGKAGSVQTCSGCNGQGIKITIRQLGPGMVQQMQSACGECAGEGQTISEKDRCKKCTGKKVLKESKILEVNVDPGMKEGERIFFRGEGDQQPDVEPGDIVIILVEKEHVIFKRSGADLHMHKTVGLTEALCGFQFIVRQLDGRNLLVKYPPGNVIQPGCQRVIQEEGMPHHRNPIMKGNLIIHFTVQFPQNHFATAEELKKLETVLPAAQREAVSEEAELCTLEEFHPPSGEGKRGEAYAEDDDDEHGGGPSVQCAHQ